jgi:hypothetical protein
MNESQVAEPVSFDRHWIKVWKGPSLLTDFRPDARHPQLMNCGIHALSGFEIAFLPEPYSDDGSRSSTGGHGARFLRDMARMLPGMHVPEVYRGPTWERLQAFLTFDLRLVASPAGRGPGRIRLFLLAKAFVPVEGGEFDDAARTLACERCLAACRLCRAVAPSILPLQPLDWGDGTMRSERVAVNDQDLALAPEFSFVGELRRGNFLTRLRPPGQYGTFCRSLRDSHSKTSAIKHVFALPSFWPESTHDLLSTCSVMAASASRIVLSMRLIPTRPTRMEHGALLDLQQSLRKAINDPHSKGKRRLNDAWQLAGKLIGQRELFQLQVQVAGHESSQVNEVLTALAGEFATGCRNTPVALDRPARLLCLHPNELSVASFNLQSLEMWPWGALDDRVRSAAFPAGSSPCGAPDMGSFPAPEELHSHEVFLQRDLVADPRLCRLRTMVSIEEAASAWRLPVVRVGGQAGLASRLSNPFEQLPGETPRGPANISFGSVRHRGISTHQDYCLPLLGQVGAYTGIGDRVIVVAGSPGAGKTNLSLHLLEQLWGKDSTTCRFPYLVIDPTRGMEFRSLLRAADDDLVIFTVGDPREVPLCFNPFVVPANVSVQGHISRLMSCFRAAWYMWDPLPAIFEEAIRLAYKCRFERRGHAWNPSATFGTGRVEDYPTLEDLCAAMGTGGPDEVDTVLAQQRRIWSADGQGTENQATIIASTSLRLKNLNDNFANIIGGPARGRACVDLNRLLKVPAVLEMGMIGDSQALSLIMAFLVVSLAGCIENRNRDQDPLHMLVIEEAHRLLSAEGSGNQEGSSSRIQAAEDLNNLLAEVRKYGQGVMLLDQRPGSLVGGVIDNAFVVALHRLNERKSFEQFADLLNLNSNQRRFARIGLEPGEAILLDRPTGIPIIVRPPPKEKEQARELSPGALSRLRERAAKLNFDASAAIAGVLENRCREDSRLNAKLDALRGQLTDDQPNLRVIRTYAKDLARGLGIDRKHVSEEARNLFLYVAGQAGLDPILTQKIQQEFYHG